MASAEQDVNRPVSKDVQTDPHVTATRLVNAQTEFDKLHQGPISSDDPIVHELAEAYRQDLMARSGIK